MLSRSRGPARRVHPGEEEPNPDAAAQEIAELTEFLSEFLHGRHPAVQSAVLGDLTAIYLAGHIVPGNAAATARKREELLKLFIDLVRDLIPPNEKRIHGARQQYNA